MLNKKPDFNRLGVFYHIYRSGSISKAAKLLHTTPSAVSQQLAKLEEELGVRLFARPHKRLVATPAAASLFDLMLPFMTSLDTMLEELRKARSVPSGLLRIGAPVEFGKIMMPPLITRYRARYPEVRFFLQIGRTAELLPLLRQGDLDFAFLDTFPARGDDDPEWRGVSLQPVFEETVVLACSDHYFSHSLQGDCAFASLKRRQFVAQQQDARAIRNWFRHSFNRDCGNIDIVLTVANHQAVVNALLCDLGLGIVVSQLVAETIAAGQLRVIDTGGSNPTNQVLLAQLLDKVPTLAEKSFQHHVFQEMDGERGGG